MAQVDDGYPRRKGTVTIARLLNAMAVVALVMALSAGNQAASNMKQALSALELGTSSTESAGIALRAGDAAPAALHSQAAATCNVSAGTFQSAASGDKVASALYVLGFAILVVGAVSSDEALDVPVEADEIREELRGRTLARPEADHLVVLVQRHQVDLRVGPIPVALNPVGEREVAGAFSAPFLVELADEALEAEALCLVEALVCLPHQDGLGPEVDGRHRVRKARQPGPQEIVPQVVAPPPGPRPGEDREPLLHHSVLVVEDFQVATDLLPGLRADVFYMSLEIAVRAAGVAGDVLQDYVVPPSQLAQEPVVRLRP